MKRSRSFAIEDLFWFGNLFISTFLLVACFPGGAYAEGGNSPSVKIVERAFISVPHEAFPVVAFSPDNRLFAEASTYGDTLRLWDWKRKTVVRSIALNPSLGAASCHSLEFLPGRHLVFSPDGRFLAAAWNHCGSTINAIVRIWNVATGAVEKDVVPPSVNRFAAGIDFSPDGEHFVIAWRDRYAGQTGQFAFFGGFTLYRTSSWQEEYTHEFASAGAAEPDGSRLLPEWIESGPEFSSDGRHILFFIIRSKRVRANPALQNKKPFWFDAGHYGVVWDVQARREAAQRLVRWEGGGRSQAGFGANGQMVFAESGDHQDYSFDPTCKPPQDVPSGFNGDDDFCQKVHRLQRWDWRNDHLDSLYVQNRGFDDEKLPIAQQRCGYLLRAVGDDNLMVECLVGDLSIDTRPEDRRETFEVWDADFTHKLTELDMNTNPSLTFLTISQDRRFLAFEASDRSPGYIYTAGFQIYEILTSK